MPTEFGPSLLTNTALAVIAIAVTAGAVWFWRVHSSAALAPVLIAAPLLFVALFGGPVWEWSKQSRGAGLGPDIRAVPFSDSIGATALLWACIGAGLSAFLLPRVGRGDRRGASDAMAQIYSRTVSIVMIGATLVALVIWLIGSGPSILARDYYLQTDGIEFLLLVGWPLCFLTALVTLVLSGFERDPFLKFCMWFVSAMAYVVMMAAGTRMAIVFPAVGALVLIGSMVRNRRINVIAIPAAVVLVGLAAFTFSVVFVARVAPHGLLNLPGLIQAVIDRGGSVTDLLLAPVKQLCASIFVAYPLAERSAQYDLLEVLVTNANPLPGTAVGRGFEVYWPYSWVPLAFVGTWYGATGWLGQVLVFCFMGWTTGYTIANFVRSRLPFASLLPIVIALALGALSIEYTSRNVWRVLSIGLVLLIVSVLIRRRRVRSSSAEDDAPPHARPQDSPADLVREPV